MNRNGIRVKSKFSSPDGRAGGGRERQRNRVDGAGSGNGNGGNAGGKKHNWFVRHRIITVVLAAVLIGLAIGAGIIVRAISDPAGVLQNRTAMPTPDETETAAVSGTSTAPGSVQPTATEALPPDYDFLKDTVNILVIGTDSSLQRVNEGGHAVLTDCIMLVSINVKTNKASVISIPRDTYVKIYNDKNKLTSSRNRINAAFGIGGGMKNESKAIFYTMNTVNQFLSGGKIPIDHYVLFDMDFVRHLIDAADGVDVEVKNLMHDTVTTTTGFTFKNNTVMHMDGKMALAYARDRHNTKGSDQGRVTHQQDVIISLLKKLKDAGTIASMIPQLFTEFKKDLFTDIDNLVEITALAWIAKDMNIGDIKQYVIEGYNFAKGTASMLVADQDKKQAVVKEVFGISNTKDGSWTQSRLQSEINAMLNAGKEIVKTAQNFLSDNAGYYTGAEAGDLRDAISECQTALSKGNEDDISDAQQAVQMQYNELKNLVQPRKEAIAAGKSAISSVKAQLNEKRGWMTEGQIDEINGKINLVQGYVDAKDYNNVGAATNDLQSAASGIFGGVSPTDAPTDAPPESPPESPTETTGG